MRKRLPLKDFVCLRKVTSSFVAVVMTLSLLIPPSYGQMLPTILAPTGKSSPVVYQPPVLRGITVHPENPLLFDFIVDRGQDQIKNDLLKTESQTLIKYFLTSLTIPDTEAWVNLSPYEANRIIPEALGQTDMGRMMLKQDYQLKQLASALTHPDTELGKKYWEQLKTLSPPHLSQSGEMGEASPNLNHLAGKVWIMPESATVVEKNGFAYITESKLRVMLDVDKNPPPNLPHKGGGIISTEVFRELILPQLEREVNESKTFAPTRQVYQSVILATWYKKALKDSLLGKVYANKSKVAGVETNERDFKQKVYEQYLEAFKKGAYNLIKEEMSDEGDVIPQKYFSGGNVMNASSVVHVVDSPRAIQAASTAIVQAGDQLALVSSGVKEPGEKRIANFPRTVSSSALGVDPSKVRSIGVGFDLTREDRNKIPGYTKTVRSISQYIQSHSQAILQISRLADLIVRGDIEVQEDLVDYPNFADLLVDAIQNALEDNGYNLVSYPNYIKSDDSTQTPPVVLVQDGTLITPETISVLVKKFKITTLAIDDPQHNKWGRNFLGQIKKSNPELQILDTKVPEEVFKSWLSALPGWSHLKGMAETPPQDQFIVENLPYFDAAIKSHYAERIYTQLEELQSRVPNARTLVVVKLEWYEMMMRRLNREALYYHDPNNLDEKEADVLDKYYYEKVGSLLAAKQIFLDAKLYIGNEEIFDRLFISLIRNFYFNYKRDPNRSFADVVNQGIVKSQLFGNNSGLEAAQNIAESMLRAWGFQEKDGVLVLNPDIRLTFQIMLSDLVDEINLSASSALQGPGEGNRRATSVEAASSAAETNEIQIVKYNKNYLREKLQDLGIWSVFSDYRGTQYRSAKLVYVGEGQEWGKIVAIIPEYTDTLPASVSLDRSIQYNILRVKLKANGRIEADTPGDIVSDVLSRSFKSYNKSKMYSTPLSYPTTFIEDVEQTLVELKRNVSYVFRMKLVNNFGVDIDRFEHLRSKIRTDAELLKFLPSIMNSITQSLEAVRNDPRTIGQNILRDEFAVRRALDLLTRVQEKLTSSTASGEGHSASSATTSNEEGLFQLREVQKLIQQINDNWQAIREKGAVMFDLERTLTNSITEVSPVAIQTLVALLKQNIRVVVVTGVPAETLQHMIADPLKAALQAEQKEEFLKRLTLYSNGGATKVGFNEQGELQEDLVYAEKHEVPHAVLDELETAMTELAHRHFDLGENAQAASEAWKTWIGRKFPKVSVTSNWLTDPNWKIPVLTTEDFVRMAKEGGSFDNPSLFVSKNSHGNISIIRIMHLTKDGQDVRPVIEELMQARLQQQGIEGIRSYSEGVSATDFMNDHSTKAFAVVDFKDSTLGLDLSHVYYFGDQFYKEQRGDKIVEGNDEIVATHPQLKGITTLAVGQETPKESAVTHHIGRGVPATIQMIGEVLKANADSQAKEDGKKILQSLVSSSAAQSGEGGRAPSLTTKNTNILKESLPKDPNWETLSEYRGMKVQTIRLVYESASGRMGGEIIGSISEDGGIADVLTEEELEGRYSTLRIKRLPNGTIVVDQDEPAHVNITPAIKAYNDAIGNEEIHFPPAENTSEEVKQALVNLKWRLSFEWRVSLESQYQINLDDVENLGSLSAEELQEYLSEVYLKLLKISNASTRVLKGKSKTAVNDTLTAIENIMLKTFPELTKDQFLKQLQDGQIKSGSRLFIRFKDYSQGVSEPVTAQRIENLEATLPEGVFADTTAVFLSNKLSIVGKNIVSVIILSASSTLTEAQKIFGENNVPTILIVEDNPRIIDAYQQYLQAFGFSTIVVSGTQDAELQLRNNKNIGAVITDLNVRGTSDEDEIYWLRKYDLPILLITGVPRAAIANFIEKDFGPLPDNMKYIEKKMFNWDALGSIVADWYQVKTAGPSSAAVNSSDINNPGGIDFNPNAINLQIKRDASGVPLPLPEQDLEHIDLQGLTPFIINIQPITPQTLPILGAVNSETSVLLSKG